MMRKILCLAVLAACSVANAQIAILPPSETVEAGRHYLLPVTGLAAADLPTARVIIEPRETASAVGVTGWAGEQYLWFAGQKTGRHFLAVVIVRDGQAVVASLAVEVGGEAPKPDPPPPPPDEELWGAVLIEESSERSWKLAAILTSKKLETYLADAGLGWSVGDPDAKSENLAPYIADAKKRGLPTLFIMGVKGHEFYAGDVPETPEAVIALIKKHAKRATFPKRPKP